MKVTIVGVKNAQTKSGRDFWEYYYQKNFTDYDLDNAECSGLTVGSEFSYKDYGLRPGQICEFQYEPGFNDKATLTNVEVLKDPVNEKLKEQGKA